MDQNCFSNVVFFDLVSIHSTWSWCNKTIINVTPHLLNDLPNYNTNRNVNVNLLEILPQI